MFIAAIKRYTNDGDTLKCSRMNLYLYIGSNRLYIFLFAAMLIFVFHQPAYRSFGYINLLIWLEDTTLVFKLVKICRVVVISCSLGFALPCYQYCPVYTTQSSSDEMPRAKLLLQQFILKFLSDLYILYGKYHWETFKLCGSLYSLNSVTDMFKCHTVNLAFYIMCNHSNKRHS